MRRETTSRKGRRRRIHGCREEPLRDPWHQENSFTTGNKEGILQIGLAPPSSMTECNISSWDEEKRAIYDQTGCVDDAAVSSEAAENLQQFFRSMFRKVTEADIEEFEANYRGSDSEKKDLKAPYKRFKGNMRRLFCSMLCSDPKLDSHRFKDIIDEAIARGQRSGQEWIWLLPLRSTGNKGKNSLTQ